MRPSKMQSPISLSSSFSCVSMAICFLSTSLSFLVSIFLYVSCHSLSSCLTNRFKSTPVRNPQSRNSLSQAVRAEQTPRNP